MHAMHIAPVTTVRTRISTEPNHARPPTLYPLLHLGIHLGKFARIKCVTDILITLQRGTALYIAQFAEPNGVMQQVFDDTMEIGFQLVQSLIHTRSLYVVPCTTWFPRAVSGMTLEHFQEWSTNKQKILPRTNIEKIKGDQLLLPLYTCIFLLKASLHRLQSFSTNLNLFFGRFFVWGSPWWCLGLLLTQYSEITIGCFEISYRIPRIECESAVCKACT